MKGVVAALILTLASVPALADNPKFRVDGAQLFYTTRDLESDPDAEIAEDDVEVLETLLEANPAVAKLILDSNGGDVWAGREMGKIIQLRGLDTHVDGMCESACVRMFLAGTTRTKTKDALIGFHQYYWRAENIADYFDRNAEDEGWDTPFDLAEWLYGDTQSEIHEHLSYMVSRGVDPRFAIQTLGTDEDGMWHPFDFMLVAAGVLTKAPIP